MDQYVPQLVKGDTFTSKTGNTYVLTENARQLSNGAYGAKMTNGRFVLMGGASSQRGGGKDAGAPAAKEIAAASAVGVLAGNVSHTAYAAQSANDALQRAALEIKYAQIEHDRLAKSPSFSSKGNPINKRRANAQVEYARAQKEASKAEYAFEDAKQKLYEATGNEDDLYYNIDSDSESEDLDSDEPKLVIRPKHKMAIRRAEHDLAVANNALSDARLEKRYAIIEAERRSHLPVHDATRKAAARRHAAAESGLTKAWANVRRARNKLTIADNNKYNNDSDDDMDQYGGSRKKKLLTLEEQRDRAVKLLKQAEYMRDMLRSADEDWYDSDEDEVVGREPSASEKRANAKALKQADAAYARALDRVSKAYAALANAENDHAL